MTTTYPGIDYSPIASGINRDKETGIRYGIIPQNDVNSDALDDVFQNGTDLDYQGYIEEAKSNLRGALGDYFSDHKWSGEKTSKLDDAVESAFDAISDGLSDNYQGTSDCSRMEYSADGYKLLTDSGGDLWVIKSPFFTYAQFCSPCAPGACHLRSPLDTDEVLSMMADNREKFSSNRCYCLGADWFNGESPCPYPIWSVETGKLIPNAS